MCFDYFWNVEKADFSEWKTVVPVYRHVPISADHPFSSVYVETVETCRLESLMGNLIKQSNGVLLVGTAGTGKTAIVRNYLHHLTAEVTLNPKP